MEQEQKELISVIVPVYNVEQYLSQCLESIIGSTYRNLEIICINDASTDKSSEILEYFRSKDKRIKIISLEQNSGQSVARNRGLDVANGVYIAFVDSDDYVTPNCFSELFGRLADDHSDVAVCGFWEIDESSGEQREEILQTDKPLLNEREWWELYRHKHTVFMNCLWNKLYRAECFQNRRFVPGAIYEDTNLQHYLLYNRQISVIRNPLYYYRRRVNSTTGLRHSKKSFFRIRSLVDRAKYFAGNKWEKAKVLALQDAIKFLYHAIYNSDMDRNHAIAIGKRYRIEIRSMMSIGNWAAVRQKAQCLMILYCPAVYHLLRNHTRV